MLELGQPMHAFDNAIVKKIEVENAKDVTKFITLDEVERELPKNTVMIKSAGEPVAIAGVMGGLKSSINDETNSVLIESACFDSYSIRKTALNIGLRTESSARYEKDLLNLFQNLMKMHMLVVVLQIFIIIILHQ